MELDDLKQSWKQLGENKVIVSEADVKRYIQNSSSSPLTKIRKNMMAELFSILAVLVALYIFVLVKKEPSNLLFLGLGVLTMITLVILGIVFPKLYNHTKTNQLSESISYSIERNIEQLQNDLNLYKKVMLFLYIPSCFAGFALSNNFNKYLIVFFILFFPIYYLIVKKWTQFFYGKFVIDLTDIRNELAEEKG